jgi:linoleoyl-CoA desaturase
LEVDTQHATHQTLMKLWRTALPTAAEIRRARRRLHLKAMFILVLVVLSYGGLVIGNWGLLVRMVSSSVLFLGLIGVATSIMHDANHGAFFRNTRMNGLLSYVADGLGTSSWLWKFKHNVLHHGATNIYGVDSDIAQAPFARLSPWQPWRSWHRNQHIYLWPLYGFFALKNLIIGDIMNLATGKIGGQPLRKRADLGTIARVIAGKVAHLGIFVVVPILFNPWWAVLAFYLSLSWLVGFVLAVTFQLAHCVEGMAFETESAPHGGQDFVPHVLRTTSDVASPVPVIGHAFRWIVGGLDHQIEHHLAPRLPHTVYGSVGRRFREGCEKAGVPYHRHPRVFAALRSHGRWLKSMGQPVPADHRA